MGVFDPSVFHANIAEGDHMTATPPGILPSGPISLLSLLWVNMRCLRIKTSELPFKHVS